METVMLYGDRLEMEKWIAVVDGRFVVVVVVDKTLPQPTRTPDL